MKRLYETFTDEEAAELAIIKITVGLNWHDFIMLLTKLDSRSIVKAAKKSK